MKPPFLLFALVVSVSSGGCGDGSSRIPTAAGPEPTTEFIEAAGARLYSVLDRPAGAGPFPAVVIGHGSGRATTADGAAYVPFLRARGFAVLRYDKRGVGQSTGTYRGVSAANSEAQVAELAGDMAAAIAFLASRPGIDGRRLGLMGTSQAGWVMVAAAERSPLVRFAIAVTGSVEPVGLNIGYEELRELPIDEAYARFAGFAGPPGYDPGPALERLAIPTLWLLGGQDRLVPTRECVKVLERLRLGGAPTSYVVYPEEGHGLPGANYWPDIDAFLSHTGSSGRALVRVVSACLPGRLPYACPH
jgi:pimeloyl-ACP methyl ester carboxylesterase